MEQATGPHTGPLGAERAVHEAFDGAFVACQANPTISLGGYSSACRSR